MSGKDERETALAESPAICGTLETPSVTSDQLRKLQELRQRRLQLKKAGPPPADAADRKKRHGCKTMAKLEGNPVKEDPDSETSSWAQNQQQLTPVQSLPARERKRQKLFWRLDTKERWERKGNM